MADYVVSCCSTADLTQEQFDARDIKFLLFNFELDGKQYKDDLGDVKNYCNDIICYYSKNDPYVKYECEKEFADTITDKQIIIDNGGHLNAESGYTEFSELLKWLYWDRILTMMLDRHMG